MSRVLEEPPLTDIVRAFLALALTISLPFVVYLGAGSPEVARTYQDAVAVVIAFYFGTSGSSGP